MRPTATRSVRDSTLRMSASAQQGRIRSTHDATTAAADDHACAAIAAVFETKSPFIVNF